MKDKDFHRTVSVHDVTYSDCISDEIFENDECCRYRSIGISLDDEIGRVQEGIQSISKLFLPGKAYPNDQVLISTKEIIHCEYWLH